MYLNSVRCPGGANEPGTESGRRGLGRLHRGALGEGFVPPRQARPVAAPVALGQMPVAHDTLAARLGLEGGISPEEVGDLRLDRLREQGTRPVAQDLGERIRDGP